MNIFNSLVKSVSDFFNCYKQVDAQIDTEILISDTLVEQPETSKQDNSPSEHKTVTVDKATNDKVDMKLIMNKHMHKRIDHLNQWLSSFTCNDISEKDYYYILYHVKKNYFVNGVSKKQLTYINIETVLRNIGLCKYSKYSPYLHSKITGIERPEITEEEREEVFRRFWKINNVYDECRPKHRLNFFNYSYVLHKIIQLMGKQDKLILFPLLKSPQKLRQSDEIWRKVCAKLNWVYISSITEFEE